MDSAYVMGYLLLVGYLEILYCILVIAGISTIILLVIFVSINLHNNNNNSNRIKLLYKYNKNNK